MISMNNIYLNVSDPDAEKIFCELKAGDMIYFQDMGAVKAESPTNGVIPGWRVYILRDSLYEGDRVELKGVSAFVVWNELMNVIRGI